MKILYVAKHGQPDSDDEGAVAHALQELGHHVVCVHEEVRSPLDERGFDFLLFHKWNNFAEIERLARKIPVVFWYFDLVDHPDPTLARRCSVRREWMARVLPHVRAGFCTDGDWVKRWKRIFPVKASAVGLNGAKLHWLPQGADSRVVGRGEPGKSRIPLLFTGTALNCGRDRESWVTEMYSRYPEFRHVGRGVYGRQLADLVASSDIVLAPDSPVTDHYWSNRVYVTLGFGGFLLHPWSKGLSQHYADGGEIVYYHDRDEMHYQIDRYLRMPSFRECISSAALERTRREHLYRHRLGQMLDEVSRLL